MGWGVDELFQIYPIYFLVEYTEKSVKLKRTSNRNNLPVNLNVVGLLPTTQRIFSYSEFVSLYEKKNNS